MRQALGQGQNLLQVQDGENQRNIPIQIQLTAEG
jgi:hypothetical protein